MKRRSIVLTAVLAGIGLMTLVVYVQGAGPFGKACCKTSSLEVQSVHMTNGAASGVGCCTAVAAAGDAKSCCAGKHDGKCSGDCAACPAVKQGTCAGSAVGCKASSGCQAAKGCQASAPETASPAKVTGGCPGAKASTAKQAGCGGCPFATK